MMVSIYAILANLITAEGEVENDFDDVSKAFEDDEDENIDFREDFALTYDQGKAVQEILNRYVNEELEPLTEYADLDVASQALRDIDYIKGLAQLFG